NCACHHRLAPLSAERTKVRQALYLTSRQHLPSCVDVLIGLRLKRGVCDHMPAVGQQDLLNDVHIDPQTHSSLQGPRITATQVSATARTLLVCSPTMPRRLSDRVVP